MRRRWVGLDKYKVRKALTSAVETKAYYIAPAQPWPNITIESEQQVALKRRLRQFREQTEIHSIPDWSETTIMYKAQTATSYTFPAPEARRGP